MAYYRKIIGEKVYLGPMNPDDAPLYTEWLNDPEVNCFLNVATTIISEHGEAEWLKQKTGTHYFRIGLMDDDRTIGNIGFVDLDHFNATAELGIFIGPKELHGKGYGTEALALALGYAFGIHNMGSVLIRVFPWNKRALAAYRKVGFKDAGMLRKAIRRYGRSWDVPLLDITCEEFLSGPWSRFVPRVPNQD